MNGSQINGLSVGLVNNLQAKTCVEMKQVDACLVILDSCCVCVPSLTYFFHLWFILVLQKSRLSALESLRKPKSRDIVVATDVAARGLDISSIATVVHYDVARMVDTFIHRAGRTAVRAVLFYLLSRMFLDGWMVFVLGILRNKTSSQ